MLFLHFCEAILHLYSYFCQQTHPRGTARTEIASMYRVQFYALALLIFLIKGARTILDARFLCKEHVQDNTQIRVNVMHILHLHCKS